MPLLASIFHQNLQKHEKGNFDQGLDCFAPKYWSKFTTNIIPNSVRAFCYKSYVHMKKNKMGLGLCAESRAQNLLFTPVPNDIILGLYFKKLTKLLD